MGNEDFLNKIIHGDSMKLLDKLEENSIDVVLTDPPYFLDKMDNNWDDDTVSSTDNHYAVKSLPAGMKFDRKHGIKFYEWYFEIAKKIKKILKPGGFFFSFSSPRLYHRMGCAVDDAKLLIRDCFIWLYSMNQPKAMSLNHFIDKMEVEEEVKEKIKDELDGWKTPKVKSCFEPILMAQKKQDKTYLNNILKHLYQYHSWLSSNHPSTLFPISSIFLY
ncbi:MAG: DNA methyltransferase [Halanaerobiales bacterium]